MTTRKRNIRLVPEVKGCYGPRVWVDISDQTLSSILTVLSVWPGPTSTRHRDLIYEYCWELPFGFTNTDIWQKLISRLNITIEED